LGTVMGSRSRQRRAPYLILSVCLLAIVFVVARRSRSVHPAPPDLAPARPNAQADQTREMADLLQRVASALDPRVLSIVINDQRAEMFRNELANAHDFSHREKAWISYAEELLNAGKIPEALDEFGRIESWIKSVGAEKWRIRKPVLRSLQAIANLRLGEEQNCCSLNNPDSCLVPIRGAGVHTRREGSSRATTIYLEMLADNPKDEMARWLLNIAAMTLGEYPDGVPAKWRVDPKTFRSEYDVKHFDNVAAQVGLNILGHAGGSIVEDLDGDGLLDIMVSGTGFQDQIRFYHNNGDGTFTERTKEAGLLGETGGLNMIDADYNNDGYVDVLVLRGGWLGAAGRFPNSLLRNNGNGTFTDVTKEAGLVQVGPTQTAVWFDYDNDGWLDLFVGFELDPVRVHPCALYHNNRDGTFTNVAREAGVDRIGYVKGVASADYDNDGWPDLYLSEIGAQHLYHNNGNGTFTDVSAKAGLESKMKSFGTFFFDYDNDGWPDLFVMAYDITDIAGAVRDIQGKPTKADRCRLYHNNRNGTFTDVAHAAHLDRVVLGMGLNFGDLDNDGFLDIYAATGSPDYTSLIPNRMFRNADGKFFQDVTTSGDFGHLQKGHGVSFADINNDGQQDIFNELGGALQGDTAYSALYANPGHDNHWITLKLEGVQTNRSAIGARIKVVLNTPGGAREVHRTVGSGGSFGCNPFRQEIGLGKALNIDRVEIYWPASRKTQAFKGLKMDAFYGVKEDQPQATLLHLKSFSWPTTATAKSTIARQSAEQRPTPR